MLDKEPPDYNRIVEPIKDTESETETISAQKMEPGSVSFGFDGGATAMSVGVYRVSNPAFCSVECVAESCDNWP
jgi:hypothetical protein